MEAVRGDSGSRKPPSQLERKRVHQQFRMSVGSEATVFRAVERKIVHMKAGAAVRLRRDIDDSRWRAGLQQIEQKQREQGRAQMIGGDRYIDAVRGTRSGACPTACVVDQHVE